MKNIKHFNQFKLNESLAFAISYEEWAKTAETEKTIQVGRSTTRDIYILPDGTYVYDHYVSPWDVFAKTYSYTVVDLTLEVNDKNKALVEKYGGEINEQWGYTDDGYGLPMFSDDTDSLKMAFEFVKNEKNNLVIQPYVETPEPEPTKYEPKPSNTPSDITYTKGDVELVEIKDSGYSKTKDGKFVKIKGSGYSIKTKDGKFFTKHDHSGYSYWYDSSNNSKLGEHSYDYVFAIPDGVESAIKTLNKVIKAE